jgi:hypothetical protein
MSMKNPWFVRFGWIHRPVSWAGWLVTALAVAFCVHIFIVIDTYSHSGSDTLYVFFPYAVPTFLLWTWIAGKKSA